MRVAALARAQALNVTRRGRAAAEQRGSRVGRLESGAELKGAGSRLSGREKDGGQRGARQLFLFSSRPSQISPSFYLSSLLRFHCRQQQLNSFLSSRHAAQLAERQVKVWPSRLRGKVVDDPIRVVNAATLLSLVVDSEYWSGFTNPV